MIYTLLIGISLGVIFVLGAVVLVVWQTCNRASRTSLQAIEGYLKHGDRKRALQILSQTLQLPSISMITTFPEMGERELRDLEARLLILEKSLPTTLTIRERYAAITGSYQEFKEEVEGWKLSNDRRSFQLKAVPISVKFSKEVLSFRELLKNIEKAF